MKSKINLTDKQELFCQEYLIDFNGTRSAIAAKYSEKTAARMASENLQKPDIQARLKELMQARAERTQITQDRILEELAYIAFFDIRKLFDDNGNLIPVTQLDEQTARALAAVEVSNEKTSRHGDEITREYLKKIKSLDKKSALELLGKHLGMFADIIRIEDANAEFQAYLQALYNYFDEHAQAQFRAFTTGQPSAIGSNSEYLN